MKEETGSESLNSNINIEIKLLLDAIFHKYGYDFRNYGKAHIKRRILHRLRNSDLKNISEIQHKVLYDPDFLKIMLEYLSITVT